MNHLVFESLLAFPDVCMPDSTCVDGTKYYECVILYVYDCLVISDKFEDRFVGTIPGGYIFFRPLTMYGVTKTQVQRIRT